MNEKPENQNSEKTDISYEEGAPQDPRPDIYSYKNIMLTESKWAWPSSGLQLVGGWAIVILVCIGCNMLAIVIDRGWDGLLVMLGWK